MATSETEDDKRGKRSGARESANGGACALADLRNLSIALQSTLEVDTVLEDLIRAATEIVRAQGGIAALCSPDGLSGFQRLEEGKLLPPEEGWTPGQPIPARLVSRLEPYLCNDPQHDPLVDAAQARRYGVKNLVSTPIVDSCGSVIGFLEIHNKCEGVFTPFDQEQLASAAQIAALAARNVHAFHKISLMGARLRESTERYRHLVEGVDGIVWEADADTLCFTFVSQRAEAMLGYPAADWLGNPDFWAAHLDPQDRERAVASRRQAVCRGEDARLVYRMLAADGRALWLRDHLRVVRDQQGRVRQLRGLMVDISEAKVAEVSLQQSQAEVSHLLAQLQKDALQLEARVAERTSQLEEINAELDSFAHSVSHDLRAPLRAMQGFAEILLEDGSLQETERIEYLTRILSAAQGMERLILDLLAYSRLSRQEIMLQKVSLSEVVKEAAQQLELACAGKRYLLEVADGMPDVVGHQAVLVQVLLNLMSNAVKFVPAGVTPSLRIWTEQVGERCRLVVADNGIGIPAGEQERIFAIFERLHPLESYPGTGVGLAIVRKAVTRLGGRVGVDSREGAGSRFWIELPLAGSGGKTDRGALGLAEKGGGR